MTDSTTQRLTEIQDAADALNAWFQSQGIEVGRAVSIMSYMIGAMAAAGDDGMDEAMSRLEIAHKASVMVAISAMILKR